MKQLFNLFLLLLFFQTAVSQDTLSRRPHLGLALSGGGAKGMAHVGVLKVLEEAGLRPDYITGTSMGSIVGGLYALGYSADSLEQIVRSQNWEKVLSDRIPLGEVVFEEKDFFQNQLIAVGIEQGKLKTPSGLIYGQQISNLLSRLCLPAYYIDDFDHLPIPFKCIATDIKAGEAVVLDSGYLPEAIRASMAIPTVFTAVKKDGLILVDGGLVHNFPVSDVKEMGADIIIGVYSGKRSATDEELGTISGILGQSIFLMSIRDAQAQEDLCHYYLEPDLSEFGAMDFRSADSILLEGEQEARRHFDKFKALADSLDALGSPYPRRSLPPVDEVRIDRIAVIGNREFSDLEITGRFGLQSGDIVSVDKIENGINNLYGTNYFDKVSYQLRKDNGQNVLSIQCVEKSPSILRAALNYDSYLNVGVLVNLTLRNWGVPASRLMLAGKIADKYRASINYLKYLEPSQQWGLRASIELNRDEIPIFRKGLLQEEYRVLDFPIDLRLQRRLGRSYMLGIGAQREVTIFDPVTGDIPFDKLTYRNYSFYGRFEINTLNRNILPQRGTRLSFEIKRFANNRFDTDPLGDGTPPPPDSVFALRPYSKLTLLAETFLKINEKSSITLSPFLGIAGNPGSTFGDFYLIGSPERLTRRSISFHGLKTNELVAQVAAGAGIGYQHFLRSDLMLGVDVNAGYFQQPRILEENNLENEFFLYGAGLSIAYNSFIGPVSLTLMYPLSNESTIDQSIRAFLFFGHRF